MTVSMKQGYSRAHSAFTLIELLIVIVVIAILAAISIVMYNGIQTQAAETTLKSSLRQAATQLGIDQTNTETYPLTKEAANDNKGLTADASVRFEYTSNGTTYCLTATSTRTGIKAFHLQDGGPITEGPCEGHAGESGPVPVTHSIWYPMAMTLWSDYQDANDNSNNYSLGQPFSLSVAGKITHLGFYKTADDTTTSRQLQLWSDSTQIATKTTSAEPTGTARWIMVQLDSPVDVTAGEYLVSYGSYQSSGHYAARQGYSWPVSNGPITGLESGRFTTTMGQKPDGSYNSSAYFADVIFVPNP